MRVKTIKLSGFKKHSALGASFDKGTNLIVGPNYAGKSSVLQALLIGLYGNSCAPGDTKSLVKTGAKTFQIEVELSTGLRILRTPGTSSASRGDAEPFARGHSAVNDAIAAEIGIDKNTFLRVYTSEQGSPQQLVNMGATELQRFVEACAGLEKLDECVKLARSKANASKTTAEALSGTLLSAAEFTELQDDLAASGPRLRQLTELGVRYQTTVEALKAKIVELKAQLVDGLKVNQSQQSRANLLERLAELGSEEVTPTDPIEAEIATIRAKIVEQDEITRLETELTKLEQALALLVASHPTESIPQLIDLEPLEADFVTKQTAVKCLEAEKTRLAKAVYDGTCPTCSRPYDTAGNTTDTLQELTKVTKNLTEALLQKDLAVDALIDGKSANRATDVLQKKREDSQARIVEVTNKANDVRGILLGKVKEDVKELSDRLRAQTADLHELIGKNKLAEATKASRTQLETALVGIPEVPLIPLATLAAWETSIKDAEEQCQETSGLGQTVKEDLAVLNMWVVGAQKSFDRHTNAVTEVATQTKLSQNCFTIAEVLSKVRLKAVGDALDTIFMVTSEFVRTCTDGDISEVLLHDGVISYREGGTIYGKASASGAQKSLIGLGMKLGLSRLVRSEFDCLILDEASSDMSEEVSMRCMLALGAFQGQVIAVSHRHQDVASNVIELGKT